VVMIDDSASFAVVAGDAEEVPPNPALAAEQAAQALRQVIAEARESRDIHALWRALLYAALATAILVATLWLARWAEGKFAAWGVSIALRHGERILLGQAGHLLFDKIGPMVRGLMHALRALVVLALVYEWLVYVLGRFALTRAWSEQLHGFLIRTLSDMGAAVVDAMPGLFTALLIFFLARTVVRTLDRMFDRVQSQQLALSWLDPDLARPTRRIANTAIWLFALAMAYPYLPGAQTDAFKGLSVLVGLMLSLGASNLVGQGASGLILTYSRVIRAGEYVRVADHEGTVVEMGMFTTRVRTGMGEELTLPNSLILGNVTRNYSRAVQGHGFIVDTTVTIGYDTPWRQVQSMLVEAAKRTPGVLADPAPHVFQIALSDFYPEYRLVCQAVPAQPRPRAEVMNLLHANIQDVFAEHGVQIMSPHYLGDPGEAKVPPLPDAVGGRAA
jgi:small-conductance mechanosensitive channel